MSRRITTKTEIKDKDLAGQALKTLGYDYRTNGDTITITSGPLSHATINLKTGDTNSDSDYGHGDDSFGILKQHYMEAFLRKEYLRTGIRIEERNMVGQTIRMVCVQ